MALGAGDLLRSGLMDQALHILVAIHAGEHRAVNGMLQLFFIHVQADLLAVHFGGQSGVGVAGKAVFIFGLVLGVSRAGPCKQGQNERLGEDSSGNLHDLEEMLRRTNPQ